MPNFYIQILRVGTYLIHICNLKSLLIFIIRILHLFFFFFLCTWYTQQPTTMPSPQKQHNNSAMIRSMNLRLLECHIPNQLHVCAPSHAGIWLGLMPLTPPLLLPSPSHPLPCWHPCCWVNFRYLSMRFILLSRSTMISSCSVHRALKSIFRSPNSSSLQFAGHFAHAAQRSSTSVMSAVGMYASITKN
jgi:hypothetical protein